MIEPEMAFCDLTGDMDLAEELVKYLVPRHHGKLRRGAGPVLRNLSTRS